MKNKANDTNRKSIKKCIEESISGLRRDALLHIEHTLNDTKLDETSKILITQHFLEIFKIKIVAEYKELTFILNKDTS